MALMTKDFADGSAAVLPAQRGIEQNLQSALPLDFTIHLSRWRIYLEFS